ncbi:hypothetical protein GCM10023238_27550 [Streptomyces heliomycini]
MTRPATSRTTGAGAASAGAGAARRRKRRSGLACLVVVVVFGGGLAGVSYFGYQFYQDRFGSAPDFAGRATASR